MIHSTMAFDTLSSRILSKQLLYVMFLPKLSPALFYKMSTGAITNKSYGPKIVEQISCLNNNAWLSWIKEKFVLVILCNFWTFSLAPNFVWNPSNSIFQFGFGQPAFTGNNSESYFCIFLALFCQYRSRGVLDISISAEGLNLPWQGLSNPTSSTWALSTTSEVSSIWQLPRKGVSVAD